MLMPEGVQVKGEDVDHMWRLWKLAVVSMSEEKWDNALTEVQNGLRKQLLNQVWAA
jgi:hypothetical protein